MTQTVASVDPWWQVQLGNLYTIREVVIYKRLDAYADGLDDCKVGIYDSAGVVSEKLIHEVDGGDDTLIRVPFDDAIGSSVRIQLVGQNRILSLAEVQVFGSLKEFHIPIGEVVGDKKIGQIAVLQYPEDHDFGSMIEASHMSNIMITQGSLSPHVVSGT